MKQPFRPARMALASTPLPATPTSSFIAAPFNRKPGLCVPGGKHRNTIFSPRYLFPALAAALSLSLTSIAGAAPLIQSLEVSPNPLVLGDAFTLTVTTASNVVQASASVVFHPGESETLEIPLTNQGSVWTGSGVIPVDLRLRPKKDEAEVKVLVFDTKRHHETETLHVDVQAPVVSAAFSGGILTVSGDNQDNQLIVSRNTAGNLLVNGGAVPITGGPSTIANTILIQMFGHAGDDTLTVDDSNGPMPPAHLFGGDGNDTLTGSANDDVLDGGAGNDTLIGRGGNDILLGGPANDILIGGQGTDQLIGGDGDDQIVWNPGDGSDVVEGGNGLDTLVFNGANISEIVDLSANGPRLRFFRNIANITMDCAGIERVVFNALSGADQVTINDLAGTEVSNVIVDLSSSIGAGDGQADNVLVNGTGTNDVIHITGSTNEATVIGLAATVTVLGAEPNLDTLVVNGLAGDDTIDASAVQVGAIALTLKGGIGNDILIGGEGDDLLIGDRGADTMIGGPGDDTFVWNPGDGSDIVEGQSGHDTMVFNGANIAETVDISANGKRVRFFRNIASIIMDCDGIEEVLFNALGGADDITVNDLSGTDLKIVNLDLGAPAGSGQGDNAADTITINATTGDDVLTVAGDASGISVSGLAATVNITGSEAANDQLIIKLLGGDDALSAEALQAGAIMLFVDGGPGADIIVGSAGADVLSGGEGDDILIGGPGNDILDGGPGNNVIIQ